MTRNIRRAVATTAATLMIAGPAGAQARPGKPTVTATQPTVIELKWTPAANAVRYWVQRSSTMAPVVTLVTPKITATQYIDAGAPAGTTLRYRIAAGFVNPPHTYSEEVTITTPSASSVTASVSSSTARLAAPTTATVFRGTGPSAVQTPGMPLSAAAVPEASGPQPSAAPAQTTGRYRVVANGFSVVQQAHSHHDDVYGGFIMLHFNRQTGQLLESNTLHTKVLGDINGRVFGETDGGDFNRLRAGTANPTGGLKSGDSYPDAGHARFRGQDGGVPNSVTFPFAIWGGTLVNDSDALVILPTLWSRDGKLSGFEQWQSSELSSASQIWWDPAVQKALRQTTLGVVAPPGSATPSGDPNFSNLTKVFGAAFMAGLGQPWALALLFDPSAHDRPIGLDPNVRGLPRRAIVLTREMIEQALNSPRVVLNQTMVVPNYPLWLLSYLDAPVGVIPVLLFDYVPPPGEPLKTAYVMYLQVERL
jgi:hypothetical protein